MAKRPNILKLATKISLESMTYMGITYDDPEYKILEPIIDDDMCAIMMHVRLETNRTVEEVAKRARKSVEFTQEQLDKLCKPIALLNTLDYYCALELVIENCAKKGFMGLNCLDMFVLCDQPDEALNYVVTSASSGGTITSLYEHRK